MTNRLSGMVKHTPWGFADFVTTNAERTPDAAAFVSHDGLERSFAELELRVSKLSDALTRHGIREGDRVALFAVDSVEYLETVLACMRIGAVTVPLNYRLTDSETDALLRASEPRALFCSARYSPRFADVRTRCPTIVEVVHYADSEDVGTYEALLEDGGERAPAALDEATILCCTFTSGTTGHPKAVMQSLGMLRSMVNTLLVEYQVQLPEYRYCASPLFHIGGLSIALLGVLRGFPSLILPQFEPKEVLERMRGGQLTACVLVPTMISTLLGQPDVEKHDYAGLRTIVYGAAPITPDLLRRAMEVFRCDFIQGFGAGTEAGLQTVLSAADHRRASAGDERLLSSVGKPAFGVQLRICDDDWNDLPAGQVGEIVCRSETTFDGYLNDPDATTAALRDGWFRGGDAGWLDNEGYLFLEGRKKDMIIRGGENIYPLEIESILADHPAILEAAVVGQPDDEWGEVVIAFVVARADVPIDPADVKDHCRQRLAAFKVPVGFRFVEELPKNAAGKVAKPELRRLVGHQ